MRLLFDSSALLNIIRVRKQDAYGLLKGNLTLSLAKYEIGNALWKEALLLGRISLEEALEALSLLDRVLEIMEMVYPKRSDLTFRLAFDLQVTYYDASYVVASIENDAKLITSDVKLARRIGEKMDTVNKVLGREPEILLSDEIISFL
jgi:predicted nucleic acid-binding protein